MWNEGAPASLAWTRCPCRGVTGMGRVGGWGVVKQGPGDLLALWLQGLTPGRPPPVQSGLDSAVTQAGQASERPPKSP